MIIQIQKITQHFARCALTLLYYTSTLHSDLSTAMRQRLVNHW